MRNKRDRFTKALQQLGHIYEPCPEDAVVEERVRHILRVFVPTGDIMPVCGAPQNGRGICCRELWADSNCEQCRAVEGVKASITKRSLMLNLVNDMCDFEQLFLDAMYWNGSNLRHEAINPDPNGEVAEAWSADKKQLESMMKRFAPTMEKHAARFGWPTDLAE